MNMQSTLAKLFAHASSIGMKGTIQFVFPDAQKIWVDIGEQATIFIGYNPEAETEIEIGTESFLNIVAGRADVEQLFAAGTLKIRGNLGLATLLPQVIQEATRGNGHQSQPAEMNRRYVAPARFSETISAALPPLRSIERRARQGLSVDEFTQRYLPTGTPVVIEDALHDWRLFKMSPDEALTHFEDLNGITRHGDYVNGNAFSTKRDFRTVPMTEFIASLRSGADTPGLPAVYMGNNILPTKLLETIRFPTYFDRSAFIAPRLWIGPKGTLSPLHRDESDNLFAQVWGQKSFVLAAPHHREALGTWSTTPGGGLEGCTFDPEAPDYTTHPQARDVPFIRIVLGAGDMLFLPEGWFHRVESISTSLSVNFWTDSWRRK